MFFPRASQLEPASRLFIPTFTLKLNQLSSKNTKVISPQVFAGRRTCRNFGEEEHARENKAGSEAEPGVLNKFLTSGNMTSSTSYFIFRKVRGKLTKWKKGRS